MFWINVDKPTKKCMIHRDGCRYEQTKSETPLKGVGELKRDGGWVSFLLIGDAENYCEKEWEPKGYITQRGHCCFS